MQNLRACEIYEDATSLVYVVESAECQEFKTKNFLQTSGTIRPLAVIVCTAKRTTAYDMEARPVDFKELRAIVPGLDATLRSTQTTSRL